MTETLPSLSRIILVGLAVWGSINLSLQAAEFVLLRYHTSAPVRQQMTNDCDCGSSISEAMSRGCVFDALASAWLPPECRDDELTAEFNRSGPGADGAWPYWADPNGTVPLTTADLARLGGTNTLWYSTREWHLVHCNFYWRKQALASQNGGRPLIERRYSGMGHIIHCGALAKGLEPLDLVKVHANVPLNSAMG